MSSQKIYTAEDIARYHRGEMTAAERHDLEKAALDDPMLADALEGYTHTTTAAADLQNLQNRLQQRLEEKKKGNVFFMGPQWLKIAALFLLLAGGGWLAWQSSLDNKREIANTTTRSVERLNRDIATDSVSTVQKIPPALFTDTLPQRNEVVASGTRRRKESPAPPAVTSSAPLSAMSDVAKENKPETDASRTESSDKAAASEIVALQSNAPANTGREAVDTGRHADVARQETADRSNEAARSRRMQSTRAKAAIPEEAEPDGGWPAFEKYIAQNRKPVEEAKKKNTTADDAVELIFDVDNNGRPVNIVVTKPRCEKCDAEAIRLLQEGPKWKGRRGKVKIPLSP